MLLPSSRAIWHACSSGSSPTTCLASVVGAPAARHVLCYAPAISSWGSLRKAANSLQQAASPFIILHSHPPGPPQGRPWTLANPGGAAHPPLCGPLPPSHGGSVCLTLVLPTPRHTHHCGGDSPPNWCFSTPQMHLGKNTCARKQSQTWWTRVALQAWGVLRHVP